MSQKKSLSGLLLGAVGVVFGDIGTSPLYALKETFAGHHPMAVGPDTVLGVLSLAFWTIMLLVTVKYVAVIMRADNRGEGGSLALLALVTEFTRGSRLTWTVTVLGIFAAALFFGDSMITPAISVLSAVEGLEVVSPAFKPAVLPVTLMIITALFWIQKRGTGAVGMVFGPVMVLWFATLAVLGLVQVVQNPGVLAAINPAYGVAFIAADPLRAFFALGAIVLAVTGGEALYTDMGHFGKRPIRLSWFGFVMPALVLNYYGQGALLLADPTAIQSPFYRLAPEWGVLPLVVLATCATVIASQAVISGAFSVARQAVQLGFLPRLHVVHTSGKAEGQIYVPFANWTLYFAVMGLVIGFQTSSNLAAAYGIAVTGTMMIDTVLVTFVMLYKWRWHPILAIAVGAVFFSADAAFFLANAIKIPQGGWFPLLIGLVTFTLLTTWKRGRALVFGELAKQTMPMTDFLQVCGDDIHRVHGTAVFMTSNVEGVPAALLHNLKHNQVLHERVVLVSVVTADEPWVPDAERLEWGELGKGFHRLIVRYGFMEQPDVPRALEGCAAFGQPFEMMETTFYLSREVIVPTIEGGMALWRERLFAQMQRNAASATEFFRIPTNRVVELGTAVEI